MSIIISIIFNLRGGKEEVGRLSSEDVLPGYPTSFLVS
jgi:hypothetical protein